LKEIARSQANNSRVSFRTESIKAIQRLNF
jgi:hypothetical protein